MRRNVKIVEELLRKAENRGSAKHMRKGETVYEVNYFKTNGVGEFHLYHYGTKIFIGFIGSDNSIIGIIMLGAYSLSDTNAINTALNYLGVNPKIKAGKVNGKIKFKEV